MLDAAFKITKCSNDNNNNKYDGWRDWSSLPADVLGAISSRLTFADYNVFGHVCTSWRLAKGPLSPQMPFLLSRRQYMGGKLSASCTLLDLTNNLSYNVRMPILRCKPCIGSQDGWLIIVDNMVGVISLYNPLSQQEIKLPSHAALMTSFFCDGEGYEQLPEFHSISKMFSFKKVVLLCAPTSSIALHAVAMFHNTGHLLYTLAGENSWNFAPFSCNFQDIFCWRGQFVGVNLKGGAVYKLNLDVPEPKFEYMGTGSGDYLTASRYDKYLVDLDGNLLQVWRLFDSYTHRTSTVKVMQLDLQGLTWTPIDDLCGHSLFLGTSHSASLSSQLIPGLKDNLIYFTGDWWGVNVFNERLKGTNWDRDVGVYNMRNGNYEICPLPNTPLPRATSTVWFAPLSSELQNGSFQQDIFQCRQL